MHVVVHFLKIESCVSRKDKGRSEIFNASRHNIVRRERKAATSNTDPLFGLIFSRSSVRLLDDRGWSVPSGG